MTTIRAGYRLTVTSWENDADNYQSNIMEGLTEPQVKFYVELLQLFSSSSHGKNNFGNMYEPSDREVELAGSAVAAVVEKHKDSLEPYTYNYIKKEPASYIGDNLLGYGEGYYYRVFDHLKIELIPHDIELEDVTSQFM